MFMTWFVVSSRTEFEIKSNHFGGRENNLWQKLANFFPLLLVFISPSPLASTDLQSYGAKGSGVDDVSRSRVQRDGGYRRRYPRPSSFTSDTRGWEFGGGSYRALRAAGGASTATRDKEREQDLVQTRARARGHATHATRTHARTQRLFTPIKGYQERIGSRRKQEPSKNTKHGQMKSIKRAENCTGTRTELSCDRWIVKIENCKIKRRSVYFKVDTKIFRILRVIGFYTKIYVKSIFERTQLNDFLKAMLLLWKKLQNA